MSLGLSRHWTGNCKFVSVVRMWISVLIRADMVLDMIIFTMMRMGRI